MMNLGIKCKARQKVEGGGEERSLVQPRFGCRKAANLQSPRCISGEEILRKQNPPHTTDFCFSILFRKSEYCSNAPPKVTR